jgi:hypothetical protein
MRAAFVALVLALALPVTAAAEAEPQCPPGQDCTVYEGFEDMPVDGQRGGAPAERFAAGGRGGQVSLLRVRPHFIPELLKSVEQL